MTQPSSEFHAVNLPEMPLAYRVSGEGPRDVLLLHGWISSSQLWEGVMPALGPHFRCWAPDLPGCGDSPLPPKATPTLDDYRGAVQNFCRSLAIRPYAVIGHSLGALIALSLAIETPHPMQRLVLLSPPVSGRIGLHMDLLLRTPPGEWLFRHTRHAWPLLTRLGMPTVFAPNPHHLTDKMRASWRKVEDAQRAAWGGTVGGALAVVHTDYRARLNTIQQPTLVVVGLRDLTIPPQDGMQAARRIPNARLLKLPDVAHQVTDEAPAEVNRALLDFLLEEDTPHAG